MGTSSRNGRFCQDPSVFGVGSSARFFAAGRRLSLDSVALMSSPSIPSSQGQRQGAEQWIHWQCDLILSICLYKCICIYIRYIIGIQAFLEGNACQDGMGLPKKVRRAFFSPAKLPSPRAVHGLANRRAAIQQKELRL